MAESALKNPTTHLRSTYVAQSSPHVYLSLSKTGALYLLLRHLEHFVALGNSGRDSTLTDYICRVSHKHGVPGYGGG